MTRSQSLVALLACIGIGAALLITVVPSCLEIDALAGVSSIPRHELVIAMIALLLSRYVAFAQLAAGLVPLATVLAWLLSHGHRDFQDSGGLRRELRSWLALMAFLQVTALALYVLFLALAADQPTQSLHVMAVVIAIASGAVVFRVLELRRTVAGHVPIWLGLLLALPLGGALDPLVLLVGLWALSSSHAAGGGAVVGRSQRETSASRLSGPGPNTMSHSRNSR
jgi:hypothetical protein